MKDNLQKSILDIIPEKDFAIGNDLVFLPEFEMSFNTLFQQKVFSKDEMEYCDLFNPSILRYASTWAAKEAVYKAFKQINQAPLPFKKIEILRSKISGKPSVNLPAQYNNLNVGLTISHDGDYIWAISLIKKI